MKISFELKADDLSHFSLYHLRNSEIVKKQIQKNRISASLSLFLLGVILGFGTNPGSFNTGLFISFLLVSILMFLLYPKYAMNKTAKRLTRSVMTEEVKKTMLTHYEFEFSDDGIVERTPFNETKMSWQAINSFKEDDDYFYLYPNPTNAYVIPKNACEHPEELRNLVNKSIG